jgi:hypothetical protein
MFAFGNSGDQQAGLIAHFRPVNVVVLGQLD